MNADCIVVLERASTWPTWVDRQAGGESNVMVLSQGSIESIVRFCGRVTREIEAQVALTRPRRAVLVCSSEGSAAHEAARSALLDALVAQLAGYGGGQVVLVADGDSAQRLELAQLASVLNDRLDAEDLPVTVMFRAAPRLVSFERSELGRKVA